MIKSMTAYGSGEYKLNEILYIVEIRAVNHRYLDIVLRMPKRILALEKDLKSLISSKARRGRIEVFIEMKDEGGTIPYELELNMPLATSYLDIFSKMAKHFDIDQEINLNPLLTMKDVVISKPAEIDLEATKHGIQEALSLALDSLNMMRCKEGAAMEADFSKRINLLDNYLDEVEKRAPKLMEEYHNRLKEKIDRILKDVAADEGRLAQEVAFFADKSDITEEIVRIKSHLNQFREYLLVDDDAIGRRLDFLIQEFNREVNTIGSKISDSYADKVVIEMKAELEKLREQAQNVE